MEDFKPGQRVIISNTRHRCASVTVLFEVEPGLAWCEFKNGDEGVFSRSDMLSVRDPE